MATNLTTDNLKKASSLNSTEYNSTLNVITADGDTLKRLPISEVVKNRIEKLSYPEKPAIVESGDTWLEEKENGKGIARRKALQNNVKINFEKDVYFFNNKVFCLTSTGYAIIDVATDSTVNDVYVTGNYKHIVSDNIFIWFIADTVEASKCFKIETMDEITTDLDASVSSLFALDDLGGCFSAISENFDFLDVALLVFCDYENNSVAGVEFSVNDSTDKWKIEKYSYNSVADSENTTHDYVTDFTKYGINFSTDKCFFGYKRTSSSKYKTIITQKKDDYNIFVANAFQGLGITPANETSKLHQLNDFEETNRTVRFSTMSDSFFMTVIWENSNSEDITMQITYNGENLYTIDDTMKIKQIALPYGKIIDYAQKSNGAFSCLFENQPFGKTVNFVPNWETHEFDIQETEAISEETKNIQKMFISDIGEIYAEQGESADTVYVAGLTYDTSIKVHTINGDKTIPTLDGMDELEQRVENVEKKVSSSENEMSLIETKINEVNKNIAAVNANVESVGEQVAQWVLIGEVKQYFGATIPDKYLLCNGQEIAQADYPELYAVIGSLSVCQSENEGMFKLPDLREVTLVGAGQNEKLSITEHDVYNVGEFKDDQLQTHKHYRYSGRRNGWNIAPREGGSVGYSATDSTNYNNGEQVGEPASCREGSTTHGKQIGVNFIIRAKI